MQEQDSVHTADEVPLDHNQEGNVRTPDESQSTYTPELDLVEQIVRRRNVASVEQWRVPDPPLPHVNDVQARDEAVEMNLAIRHEAEAPQVEDQGRAEEAESNVHMRLNLTEFEPEPCTQMEHIDELEEVVLDFTAKRPPPLPVPCDLHEIIVCSMHNTQEGERVCRELRRIMGVHTRCRYVSNLNDLLHLWQINYVHNSVEDLLRLAKTIGSQQLQRLINDYRERRSAPVQNNIHFYISHYYCYFLCVIMLLVVSVVLNVYTLLFRS